MISILQRRKLKDYRCEETILLQRKMKRDWTAKVCNICSQKLYMVAMLLICETMGLFNNCSVTASLFVCTKLLSWHRIHVVKITQSSILN